MSLGLDAGTYRWGSGWDLSWGMVNYYGLDVRMSDEATDSYAHGHNPNNPIPVRHHIWRSSDVPGQCELHLTTESGLHYLFSFKRGQAWSSVRYLTEVISRMSETGKK